MEKRNVIKKWLDFITGIVIIALFAFVIGPLVQNQFTTFRQLAAFIDQYDIETGAYVYTDLELTAQAVIGARSTMEHPPKGPKL